MKKRKRLYLFIAIICVLAVFVIERKSDTKQNNIIKNNETKTINGENLSLENLDINLTELSSTMVYSEVYNMMASPENYYGKVVKMKGLFDVYTDEKTGKTYYSCIIKDATACCAQGIEFVLDENLTYPDDYPEVGSDVTITGIFETYDEDGNTYCRLTNAKMI